MQEVFVRLFSVQFSSIQGNYIRMYLIKKTLEFHTCRIYMSLRYRFYETVLYKKFYY